MYTPKFLRRSIFSICIGFDGITIYTELDGRVYRVVSETESQVFIEQLSNLFPNLFIDGLGKFGEQQTYVNLSLLPKFDQSLPNPMLAEHRHWLINPDWSLAERAYNSINPQWKIDDRKK